MNAITEGLVSIALAIVGLGIIATLVSKNAQTSQVANALSSGFAMDLSAAEGPVTGYNPTLGVGSNGLAMAFGGFGGGFPQGLNG